MLAPVLANILVIHTTMQPIGLPPAILATILWFIVAWPIRSRFAPIFTAQ
jgi:putative oxidoreductase